jgi:serine/threonine-protein kinase
MTDATDRLRAALADRYRIERELGQGGMATVYLAEDLKHHRRVAVKVLRPELAARLQHPHILGLIDSGDADGFFYYVMPYVEGETLRLREGARARELRPRRIVYLDGMTASPVAP